MISGARIEHGSRIWERSLIPSRPNVARWVCGDDVIRFEGDHLTVLRNGTEVGYAPIAVLEQAIKLERREGVLRGQCDE